jgi:hypothetical protein
MIAKAAMADAPLQAGLCAGRVLIGDNLEM